MGLARSVRGVRLVAGGIGRRVIGAMLSRRRVARAARIRLRRARGIPAEIVDPSLRELAIECHCSVVCCRIARAITVAVGCLFRGRIAVAVACVCSVPSLPYFRGYERVELHQFCLIELIVIWHVFVHSSTQ